MLFRALRLFAYRRELAETTIVDCLTAGDHTSAAMNILWDIVFNQLLSGQALQTSCCWQTPSSCLSPSIAALPIFQIDRSSREIIVRSVGGSVKVSGLQGWRPPRRGA